MPLVELFKARELVSACWLIHRWESGMRRLLYTLGHARNVAVNVVLMKLCIVVIPTCPLHFSILPCTQYIGLKFLLVPCHIMKDCTCSLHVRQQTLLNTCTTIVAFIAFHEHRRSQDSGRKTKGQCMHTDLLYNFSMEVRVIFSVKSLDETVHHRFQRGVHVYV